MLNGDADGAIVGDPPPMELKVGSLISEQGGGDVTVVAAPAGAPGQKWVRINHPAAQTPPTALRAETIRTGRGKYKVLMPMYIAEGAETVTVQLETADTKGVILRIDFLPAGGISVNRGAGFGNVPRNQAFVLSVMLDVTKAAPTAEVGIVSGGDGSAMVSLQPPFDEFAARFGAIRFAVAPQDRARFFVTDLLGTRTDG